ncbi:MAG: hypothetical protein ACRDVL_07315 [Acidimicrobiia bacterium]
MIKLDPATLEPVPGLDPIPIDNNSWGHPSSDGSLVTIFRWDEENEVNHIRVIDVAAWKEVARFQEGPWSGMTLDGDTLYAYNFQGGQLLEIDLRTGQDSVLDDWSPRHSLREGPILLPGSRIGGIAAEPVAAAETADYDLLVHDLETGITMTHPLGPLGRVNPKTGVFDGEQEIPETDEPGIVWDDDRLLFAYIDGPEVVEVDLESGDTQSHLIELSSWWDRLWAFWMPTAHAKGPSLGTYTSAALSDDGRYLFISGNGQTIETADDGTLVEGSKHLGLLVVDTETWRAVPHPDLPIQYVRKAGAFILGVNTTSFQPWTDEYHVLSIDQPGTLQIRGPITVSDGRCQPTTEGRHLLCAEWKSKVDYRLIDIETLEVVAMRTATRDDTLLPNGVLIDLPPRLP